MFGGIGMWEIILIFLVALLLFGAKRLPEIGSSLGKGIREFKGSLREIEGEFKLPPDPPERSRSSEHHPPDDENDGEPRKLTTSN
jgi:sec-independent protein translocase protein TatA